MDPDVYRKIYREFADAGKYPDYLITYWNTVANGFLAGSSVGADRWGTLLDYGCGLFIAHHLVLDQRNQAIANAGGIPGVVDGPATAKAVDKVSKSMDTAAVTWEDEPFWNQTAYGTHLVDLFRMIGAGGIQVGAGGYQVYQWGLYLGGPGFG